MHLKFSVVNAAEPTWNAFYKQMSKRVQSVLLKLLREYFKKAVPIQFVNYFTSNNILLT